MESIANTSIQLEDRIFQGLIADDASSPNDEISVRIPEYDASRAFGPVHFTPRPLLDGSALLPSRNDSCVVALDDDDNAVLLSWWSEDPTTIDARVQRALPTVTNPKGLRRWRAALADALAGQAVINVIGDSISVGVGSDGSSVAQTGATDATYRASGWVGQLRSLLAAVYGDPGEGAVMGTDPGNRVTLAGGASFITSVGAAESGVRAAANTQTITYLLPVCTDIDLWVWNGGSGSPTYNVDAAGAVTFSGGGNDAASTSYNRISITGLANTTHTLVITGPASGTVYVAAVVAMKKRTGVLINRYAKTGNTSANLVGLDSNLNGNSAGQTRMMNSQAKAPQADLVIIALGVNDFTSQNSTAPTNSQPGTDPTSYATNLQTMVNIAVAAGACVLLVGEPRQNAVNYPSPMTYAEQDYFDRAKAIAAATDHCAFIDVNEVWISNVLGQSLNFYTTGSVHPTRRGHGDIARTIYKALTQVAPGL